MAAIEKKIKQEAAQRRVSWLTAAPDRNPSSSRDGRPGMLPAEVGGAHPPTRREPERDTGDPVAICGDGRAQLSDIPADSRTCASAPQMAGHHHRTRPLPLGMSMSFCSRSCLLPGAASHYLTRHPDSSTSMPLTIEIVARLCRVMMGGIPSRSIGFRDETDHPGRFRILWPRPRAGSAVRHLMFRLLSVDVTVSIAPSPGATGSGQAVQIR